jgi:hypothetical protein
VLLEDGIGFVGLAEEAGVAEAPDPEGPGAGGAVADDSADEALAPEAFLSYGVFAFLHFGFEGGDGWEVFQGGIEVQLCGFQLGRGRVWEFPPNGKRGAGFNYAFKTQ